MKSNNMEPESHVDAFFQLTRRVQLVLLESVHGRSSREADGPAACQGDISARAGNLCICMAISSD